MIETIFKHTELGLIPEEWKVKKLGKLCSKISDGIHTTPKYTISSKYKFINGNNLCSGKILITENTNSISKEEFMKYRQNLSEKTILYSINGTIGNIAIYRQENVLLGKSAAYINLNIDINYKYVYWFLQSKSVERFFSDELTGSTIRNLSLKTLNNTPICIPLNSEQTRIASALTSIDNLIMSISSLIEKKKQIKQGAIQELLSGKKRLKGYTEPWVEYSLGDLLDYEQPTNYLVQSTEYEESGTPVLTAGKSLLLGYTNDKFGIFNELPVILFDDFTTASKFITYPFKVKSSAAKMLKLKNKKDNIRLIFEIMQVIDFPLTDHKRYWISQYSKIRVFLPSSQQEQSAIASVITSMDNEIIALEAKRDKYVAIKSGMMQQLLTGKIRLI